MYYYTDDGSRFDSKILAIKYAKAKKQSVKFYYYDHIYKNLDWTQEPAQSLPGLYKEQALRIRDNYDYIILCYSGGYDSTNILETFYYNNIKLDKIISVGAFSKDSSFGVDENHNGEIYHNVYPYIKELGLESIFETYDYTKLFDKLDNLSITEYGSEWFHKTGSWFSPHNWFWRDIHKFVIPKSIVGKRVAIIFGKDKPNLFYSQECADRYNMERGQLNCFYFRDTPVNAYGNVYNTLEYDLINFYWDPAFPQILLKQVNILANYYQNSISKISSYNRVSDSQIIGNSTVSNLVYSLKKPILFKSPKSPSNILSLRDQYVKNSKDSDLYKFYFSGINNLAKVIDIDNELPPIKSIYYRVTR
jgi:hypothetical protein